jgi:hypothetical protein
MSWQSKRHRSATPPTSPLGPATTHRPPTPAQPTGPKLLDNFSEIFLRP